MATNYLIFSCTNFHGLDLIISNYHKCPSAFQTCTVTVIPSTKYFMFMFRIKGSQVLSHAHFPSPRVRYLTTFKPYLCNRQRPQAFHPFSSFGPLESIWIVFSSWKQCWLHTTQPRMRHERFLCNYLGVWLFVNIMVPSTTCVVPVFRKAHGRWFLPLSDAFKRPHCLVQLQAALELVKNLGFMFPS